MRLVDPHRSLSGAGLRSSEGMIDALTRIVDKKVSWKVWGPMSAPLISPARVSFADLYDVLEKNVLEKDSLL